MLATQANYYQVRLEPQDWLANKPQSPVTLLCTRRSRLMKIGQTVMVGDRVVVEEPDWQGLRGAIGEVLPRRSVLDRPPVANADQILLVFALAEPALDPYQLSRFLVKAESTGLEVRLCLSKQDLVTPAEQTSWLDRLQHWGYNPSLISVSQGQGLANLLSHLQQKITIVSGPSGVGKSSLINWFIPQVALRTGAVSGKLARGRHTTRHVELFELPGGGLLADTPGFNQPELMALPQDLAQYFPEIRERLKQATCQFSDCLHHGEPNCAVRGEWERYEHYLEFLTEAIAYQQVLERQSNPESALKRKTKGKGHATFEPKLASEKYRRRSRRMEHQVLFNQELEEL